MNVRITVNEALNNGAIVGPPNQNRSIRRLGKGACEDQVPTAVGLPREREMRLAERGAPSYVVTNQRVLQHVVTHEASVVCGGRRNASTSRVSLRRSPAQVHPDQQAILDVGEASWRLSASLAPNLPNRGLSGITRWSETAALNRHDKSTIAISG